MAKQQDYETLAEQVTQLLMLNNLKRAAMADQNLSLEMLLRIDEEIYGKEDKIKELIGYNEKSASDRMQWFNQKMRDVS